MTRNGDARNVLPFPNGDDYPNGDSSNGDHDQDTPDYQANGGSSNLPNGNGTTPPAVPPPYVFPFGVPTPTPAPAPDVKPATGTPPAMATIGGVDVRWILLGLVLWYLYSRR